MKRIFLVSVALLLLFALSAWACEGSCEALEKRYCNDSELVSIKDIRENPEEFLGKWVLIRGEYEGWDKNKRLKEGPPVTRSDWVVYDGSGAMYVSTAHACGCVRESIPRFERIGQKIKICAMVNRNERNQIYLDYLAGCWIELEKEPETPHEEKGSADKESK